MLKKTVLLIMVLALMLVFIGCEQKAPEREVDEPEVPGAAAAQALKGVDMVLLDQQGKEVKLGDYAGKIIVLEWMNYDCPFVKPHYEKGTFAELAKKYAEKNVVWLGINSTNYATVETNKAWADQHNVPYPILDDHEGKLGRAYSATNTPHIYVMDTNGERIYVGAIDNAPLGKLAEGQTEYVNYVDKVLAELTSGKAVTLSETKPYGCTVKYAN
jgi:peroxiredoxin